MTTVLVDSCEIPTTDCARCRAFLLSDESASGLIADAQFVYWSDNSGVVRLPIAGGEVEQLVTDGAAAAEQGIALDDDFIYWIASPQPMQSELRRVALTGGEAISLTKVAAPSELAVADGRVFFGTGAKLMSVAVGGGTPEVVTELDGVLRYVVTDRENVYWSEASGAVRQLALLGGEPVTLSAEGYGGRIATDGRSIFFDSGGTSRKIMRVPIGGGDTETVASGLNSGFAVDSDYVYFSNGVDLLQVSVNGGPSWHRSADAKPTEILVNASNIVWSSSVNGGVWTLAK